MEKKALRFIVMEKMCLLGRESTRERKNLEDEKSGNRIGVRERERINTYSMSSDTLFSSFILFYSLQNRE